MNELVIKKAERHERQRPKYVYPQYGRPYQLPSWKEYESKPRLYVSVEGENVIENFAYRFDRPYKLYRQRLPEMLAKLGLPATTKARWSQKAGCSCGCSPGFILTDSGASFCDFWVTLEASQEAQFTEVTDRAVSRADQLLAQL